MRRPRRLCWAAAGVVLALVGGSGIMAASAATTGSASVLISITPCRLMDTRSAAPVGPRTTALTSGETYAVTVRGTNGQCTIPTSATALSLNITIDNPTTSSYLTVFPADVDRPLASSLNWVARQAPTPNAVTSLIGGDDRIGLFNFNGTVDVIVDIVGYYELAPSGAGATGPAGPAGPVGAAGPQGPVGAQGAIGNQGSAGAAGAAGAAGPVGDVGLKGPTGDTGATGAKGPIGDTGPLGPTGDQGPTGNTGATGGPGASGPSGPDGTTGARYGHPIAVSTPIDSPAFDPAVAIGVDGYPVLAYHDTQDFDLKFVRCANTACTNINSPVVLDSTGYVGLEPSIAIGADGSPIIAYASLVGLDDLIVLQCTNPACTSHDPPRILLPNGHAKSPSLTVGADGNPVIAYYHQTLGFPFILHCTSPSCSTFDPPRAVDSSPDDGHEPQITIGSDGYPIIAYWGWASGDVRIVHCTNISCSTSEPPRVISAGFGASIAIGVDGYPIVAYDRSGHLAVVHCTTVGCSTFDSPRILDPVEDPVAWQTISIAADGNPVIAFTERIVLPAGGSEDNLKLVQCLTPSCSAALTPRVIDRGGQVGQQPSSVIGADGALVVAYDDWDFGPGHDDAIRVAVVTSSSLTKNGWGD